MEEVSEAQGCTVDRVEQAKGSFLIMESRRKFLTMLLASGVPLAVAGYTVHAQESQTKPPVKPPIKNNPINPIA